jgi:competence protein ComEC
MTRRVKIFIIGGAAISIFGLCLFLFFYPPQRLLEVDFLDVGQGDAILIKSPYGQNILIDGGPDNKVLAELGRNLPWLDRKIDLIILTHPHDDHVSGLIDVLKKYQVERILMTAVLTHPASAAEAPLPRGEYAPPFKEFLQVLAKKKTPVIIVAGKQTITLGDGLVLEILYPGKNNLGADLNENSIVAKLIYKNKEFLFVGDAGIKTETELLAEKADLKADALKVGHHGSETSSSLDFLRAVAPSIAIIEVGVANQFGFPKADTLWRLNKVGAKIFRTDLNGTIKIKTDGKGIEVRSKKQ